jgi:hypothetical protein
MAIVTSILQKRAIWLLIFLLIIGGYALNRADAETNGIIGVSKVGCTDCHGASPKPATIVKLGSSTTQFVAGQTYDMTLVIRNPAERAGGCNISVQRGKLQAISGSGLKLLSRELTHNAPRMFTTDSVIWHFKYVAPATPGTDVIYAAGNAVNNNGKDDANDAWNVTSLTIEVVAGQAAPKLELGTTPSFSTQINVPQTQNFTFHNSGAGPLTIFQYRIKPTVGTQTSFDFGDSSAHSVAAGASATIGLKFQPTVEGTYVDTLVINSDDPTTPVAKIVLTGIGLPNAAVSDGDQAAAVTIGPNPASTYLTISKSSLARATVSIVDASGRVISIRSDVDLTSGASFDLHSLANGAYLLRIEGDRGVTLLRKFVVRR